MRGIYAVYDLKSESIVGSLILERLDGPAIRAFQDALEPKNATVLSQHPEDFELKLLGSMDDSGEIIAAPMPATIATGAQWAAGQYLNSEMNK